MTQQLHPECDHLQNDPSITQVYRIKHMNDEMDADCANYFEVCSECKDRVMMDGVLPAYMKWISNGDAEILICPGDGEEGSEHKSPSFAQYPILRSEDEEQTE